MELSFSFLVCSPSFKNVNHVNTKILTKVSVFFDIFIATQTLIYELSCSYWNELPDELIELETLESFKSALADYLNLSH